MTSIFGCGNACNNCGASIYTQINAVAGNGEISVLDQLSLAEYDSVQWNIVIVDPSQNKRRMVAIFATHEGGITPFHNEIARIGSSLEDFNYTLDVDITLGSFRLKINNNSLQDYILEITRIPVEKYVP